MYHALHLGRLTRSHLWYLLPPFTKPLRSSKKTRKFGTPLPSNLHKTPDNCGRGKLRWDEGTLSSTKKVVRVRRTPQPSGKTTPFLHETQSSNEKTVVFAPGPVGLQLEPVNEDPVYGCRVVRFVDGGPKNPGQARQSGEIQPGDWVLKVVAEGLFAPATTYEEILRLLKHTHVKRTLTVKSMWDDSFFEANPKSQVAKATPITSIRRFKSGAPGEIDFRSMDS